MSIALFPPVKHLMFHFAFPTTTITPTHSIFVDSFPFLVFTFQTFLVNTVPKMARPKKNPDKTVAIPEREMVVNRANARQLAKVNRLPLSQHALVRVHAKRVQTKLILMTLHPWKLCDVFLFRQFQFVTSQVKRVSKTSGICAQKHGTNHFI